MFDMLAVVLNVFITFEINPLSANPIKWSNTLNSLAVAEKLFECVYIIYIIYIYILYILYIYNIYNIYIYIIYIIYTHSNNFSATANELSVFDHFMGLALNGLISNVINTFRTTANMSNM